MRAERASVSLGTLASESLTARAAAIADKNLTIDDDGLQDAVWTQGSPTLLSRMVENIIDNAIVHNQDGGWIRVAATTEHATERATEHVSAQLVVETSGAVLEQDHVARLGQPFQRLVADRTGSETGAGLGLSIVAAVAGAHGGGLDLHARPDGGLRVTVRLPPVAAPQGGEA